jgi:hypothetical protein
MRLLPSIAVAAPASSFLTVMNILTGTFTLRRVSEIGVLTR